MRHMEERNTLSSAGLSLTLCSLQIYLLKLIYFSIVACVNPYTTLPMFRCRRLSRLIDLMGAQNVFTSSRYSPIAIKDIFSQ